jgi:alpha-glucosidase (family GH31 glycosyl hydrolase)
MDGFKDFTFDAQNFPLDKVQKFVGDLHKNHQRYVLIVDPAIKVEKGYEPYEDGIKDDIFIKNPDGSVFTGKVWPGCVLFVKLTR